MGLMVRALTLITLPLLLSACASVAPKFVAAVETQGATQVVLGDIVFSGCGNENEFARKFTAMGPDGYEVEGVVCGGLLGPTVYGMDLTPAALALKQSRESMIASTAGTPAQ
jgi:hypothetical protein